MRTSLTMTVLAVFTAVAVTCAGVVLASDSAAHAGPAQPWQARPATYDSVVERDVPITMSDGVRLYADIYRPARDGAAVDDRFPVVLTQTPYNKNAAVFANEYLVTRGYVHVVVDVRGTGSSRGLWSLFGERERRDGFELVEWVASQERPWSDGTVGTLGPSYMAINQIHTAAQRPKGLKAAFAMVPAADLYRDIVMPGGQLDASFMPAWLVLVTGAKLVPPAYTATQPGDGTLEGLMTLLEHGGTTASFSAPLALEMVSGGDRVYDSGWWRERAPINHIDNVEVPTFFTAGWFDVFQRGTPMLFDRLEQRGVPAKMVVGPWNHLQGSGTDLTDPGTPSPAFDEYQLRWFDHYLRGEPDPALDGDIPPISYFELGGDSGDDPGQWTTAKSWMPEDVRARTLQLSGPAGPGSPGELTPGDGAEGADTIVPIPVTGLCTRSTSQWTAGNPLLDATCGADQRIDSSLGTAYDLPVEEDLRLFGPVNARLYLSTTADDGMVVARLESVGPDGTVKQLSAGWQVLSLRELDRSKSLVRGGHVLQPWHPFTRESEQPMADIMETHVEIFPTGAVVPAGHRLRLNLQAFDTPHTLPPLPQAAKSVGVITVQHGPDTPSQVVLPVRE